MIDLYNSETNEKLGSITEADLQVLVDGLEEESAEDQDYFIDEATRVITVNVEGSTFPNFTGGTQTRILSFNGDDEVTYLNPTPSHGGAPAKVTYKRAK